MLNLHQPLLFLIGTPERAKSLRKKLDYIQPTFADGPLTCPVELMFGKEVSARAYAHARIRPSLDAWDTGEISVEDLRRLCVGVERGYYDGPVFNLPQGGVQ